MAVAVPTSLFERLEEIVEARVTKLVLALLIVLSFVPPYAVERALRPVFLLVFGCELLVRVLIMMRVRRWRRRSELAFVLVDLAAFVSFLPLEAWIPAHEWTALTLLRLSRLLMLVRFARELALDIYSIVTRREQLQQFGLVTGAVLALTFVSAVVLSQLRVPHEYSARPEGGETFLDQLWWTFRQLESADNLVQHVRVHPLVLLVSLSLTIMGVFVVSYIIGIGTNVVDLVIRTERLRPIDYRGHTIVIGPVERSELLVREFVRLYAKNRALRRQRPRKLWRWLAHGGPPPYRHALPRMALLGPEDSPPAYLYDREMRWVVYRTGDAADPTALERIGAARAKRAILLANPQAGHDTDALTLAALAAFRAANPEASAYVELAAPHSRELAEALGGEGTFALEVPHLMGLFLCQHVIDPTMQAVYQEMLTAEGSELYTHIFIEPSELAALESLSRARAYLPFAELARRALADYGVLLVGVFLGPATSERSERASAASGGDRGTEPAIRTSERARQPIRVDRLVQWLNPYAWPADDPRIESLGARRGEVPVAALYGLIGVADTYLPLRNYARALASGKGGASTRASHHRVVTDLARRIRIEVPGPSRVLVVGFSPALPSMLHSLARFVPGVEILLVLGDRGDEAIPLARRLELLGIGLTHDDPPPGDAGRSIPMVAGGRLMLFTHDGPDLASFAGRCLANREPIQSAVFLSEPEAADRDARTSMRLLRFARGLEQGNITRPERLHILAEFASLAKGHRLQRYLNSRTCGFADETCLRLTFVSTDQIKNYFMVHSAFVPGVTAIYSELLCDFGQEIVRLPLGQVPVEDRTSRATLSDFTSLLQPRQVIPIAVELVDGRLLLNPKSNKRFELGAIAAIYAVGDAQRLVQT